MAIKNTFSGKEYIRGEKSCDNTLPPRSSQITLNLLLEGSSLLTNKTPLYNFNINPNTWEEEFKNKITTTQTRGGWVEEHWGQELDVITASGSTGGMMHDVFGYAANSTGSTAFTSAGREDTYAYKNLLELLEIYRNNGCAYDNNGIIISKGSVVIYYDDKSYLGFFQTFSWREDAEKPYQFDISFTFKVEKLNIDLYI